MVADALRALDIPYIALNPGASYRGLHDSLVNYLGNERPQMLLCLHEESAVAIAHGYAKVTGKAMAAAVHSNVGLMHATMAIFNAWCDRMPMVVLGATGPVDAIKRRPWIDWIHTARDQGALVRGYTKWDDQPASPVAAREAVLRAGWIANTAPRGPTYVNLDAEMQESKLAEPVPPIDAKRYMPEVESAAPAEAIKKAADLLRDAKHPVILAGRVSRDLDAWNARVALAERLNARVVTDMKVGAAFPTDHPLHAGAPGTHGARARGGRRHPRRRRHSQPRLGRYRRHLQARSAAMSTAKVVQVSVDHHLHNGWSMDYQGLPPVDVLIACEPDAAVPALLAALGPARSARDVVSHAEVSQARRRQAHRRSSRRRAAPRGRRSRPPRSPMSRCRGTAQAGRCAIRSTISAPTAAAASAADPAFRSAPRWRSKAPAGCRSRSAATATS